MNGDGMVEEYNGGWSDYFFQKAAVQDKHNTKSKNDPSFRHNIKDRNKTEILSFTQLHRLKELPIEINKLSAKILEVETILSDADIYTNYPDKFLKLSKALGLLQKKLAFLETEWLNLEELSEKKV